MQNQSTSDDFEKMPEEAIRRRGRTDGRAAGSWVIDGNTLDETCARILGGIEEGDPEILDALPTLALGEWADDPTFEQILAEEGLNGLDADAADDLWFTYSDAWYAGMVEQAESDCRARIERGDR